MRILNHQTGETIVELPDAIAAAELIEYVSDNDISLEGADLSGLDLTGCQMGEMNLKGAYIVCTDFRAADLRGVDFTGADIAYSIFRDANVTGANFSNLAIKHTDFSGAHAWGTKFLGTFFTECSFDSAYLNGSNFTQAAFSHCNLADANLMSADLSLAWLRNKNNLAGAEFSGAKLDETRLPPFQIPQEGDLIGWKKLSNGAIAKVLIPDGARRTGTPVGRKCRAEYVRVLEIHSTDGHPMTAAPGWFSYHTTYRVGEEIYPDRYDPDIRVECTHGIHFFLTKEEAEDF